MLQLDILTLFPQLFGPFLEIGLLGKAIREQHLAVHLCDFREYGLGKHKQVDDEPYGGGPGMLLRIEPIWQALHNRESHHRNAGRGVRKLLLTPQGKPFRQETVNELSESEDALILVCGRYEGFDERIRSLVDEEISGGDFICFGGEVIAMTMIEAITRLLPGVLGNAESSREESFSEARLEHPQYTRPPLFEGMAVPEVLLSWHHGQIAEWRRTQAQERTVQRRPDLLKTS